MGIKQNLGQVNSTKFKIPFYHRTLAFPQLFIVLPYRAVSPTPKLNKTEIANRLSLF